MVTPIPRQHLWIPDLPLGASPMYGVCSWMGTADGAATLGEAEPRLSHTLNPGDLSQTNVSPLNLTYHPIALQ